MYGSYNLSSRYNNLGTTCLPATSAITTNEKFLPPEDPLYNELLTKSYRSPCPPPQSLIDKLTPCEKWVLGKDPKKDKKNEKENYCNSCGILP